MQFTVNVNKFCNHVAMVTPVIGKSYLPVLNNVLIIADGKNISLCGSNMVQQISTGFEHETASGACTVPARKLLSLLDSLPQEEDVTFISDDEKNIVTLTVEAGEFTLLGHPAADFPLMSVTERKSTVTLPEGVLGAMIDHCKNAVNKDDTRPALNGLFLNFQPDATATVATDGKRMAIYSVTAENDVSVLPVIIPSAALPFIGKVSGELELTADGNFLEVRGSNVTVVTKLIAGTYPNYKQVIPRSFTESVEVNGELLANAIKLVTPVVEANQSITLVFDGDHLDLHANSSSIGSATYTVPLEVGTSKTIEVNLNPAFLLNALNGTKEKVTIGLNDTLSPMQITVAEDVFTIIMPLRRK